MTRKQAIARLAMLTFGMVLGKMDVVKAQTGQLTVPLDQWRHIVFERRGKRIVVTVDQIFDALASEVGN